MIIGIIYIAFTEAACDAILIGVGVRGFEAVTPGDRFGGGDGKDDQLILKKGFLGRGEHSMAEVEENACFAMGDMEPEGLGLNPV
jgi:hypothetical protein